MRTIRRAAVVRAEEKLGIRIEDIVLVTANGAKVLSAALPKEPEEVEKALAR